MDKAFLKEIGISDENITKIMQAHSNEIKDGYVPLARFNEVNTAKKNADETVKTMTKQLDDLKKVGAESLQSEIDRLKAENTVAQEKYEKDLTTLKKNNALDKALTAAHAKNMTAARAFFNLDDLELDGDNIKGIDKKIKALSDDEATSFLFASDKPDKGGTFKGVTPTNPPSGGNNPEEGSLGASFAQKFNARFGAAPNNQNNNE